MCRFDLKTAIYCGFAVYAVYRVAKTIRKRWINGKKYVSDIKHADSVGMLFGPPTIRGSLGTLISAICELSGMMISKSKRGDTLIVKIDSS